MKKWGEAKEHLEQSWRLFMEIGSEEFLAELCRHQAESALGQKELDEALSKAQRSLDYARTHNMRIEEGMTQRILGRIHRERGDLAQAQKDLILALDIAQEAHKRYEIALVHLELAHLRIQQGRANEGRALAQQAAQAFAELGAQLDLQETETLLQQTSP
jgi:tetratricopeptide (TPR) repeat protein